MIKLLLLIATAFCAGMFTGGLIVTRIFNAAEEELRIKHEAHQRGEWWA